MSELSKPFEVFVSFAPEDKNLREQLEKQLISLKHQQLIITKDHSLIEAGTEVEIQIERYINEAHIILLLLSSDFFNNFEQCYKYLEKLIEQHKVRKARVIPIILRPVDWKNTLLGNFKVLPKNEVPITKWDDGDEAFLNVVEGIRELVKELVVEKYKTKISLYTKEVKDKPNDYIAWRELASAWEELGGIQKVNFSREEATHSYEEAIVAYRKLIELQPDSYIALSKQGSVLEKLEQPEAAAESYEKALEIKSDDYILLSKNGSVQEKLGRHDKAVASYDKILQLNQDDYVIWTERGTVLRNLGRYKEAIDSYNRSLKIKPNYRAAKYHQRLAYRKER